MGRRIHAEAKVTDVSGNVTFTFSPAFTESPVISVIVESVGTDLIEARITAISTSSVTINVRKSEPVTISSVDVLKKPVALPSATVHVHASEMLT